MKRNIFVFISLFMLFSLISLQVYAEITEKKSGQKEQNKETQLIKFLQEESKAYEYFDFGIKNYVDNYDSYTYEKEVIILTSNNVDITKTKKEISQKIEELNLNYALTIHPRKLKEVKAEKRWTQIDSSISDYLEREKQIDDVHVHSSLKFSTHSNSKAEVEIKNYSDRTNDDVKNKITKFLNRQEMKEQIGSDSYTVNVVKK